jgi:hypothetical protein
MSLVNNLKKILPIAQKIVANFNEKFDLLLDFLNVFKGKEDPKKDEKDHLLK